MRGNETEGSHSRKIRTFFLLFDLHIEIFVIFLPADRDCFGLTDFSFSTLSFQMT